MNFMRLAREDSNLHYLGQSQVPLPLDDRPVNVKFAGAPGIEPESVDLEATVLPLNDTPRITQKYCGALPVELTIRRWGGLSGSTSRFESRPENHCPIPGHPINRMCGT